MISAPPTNLPPQNIDCEESILGGILTNPEALYRIKDTLPVEAFYLSQHQTIYRAVLALCRKGQSPDLMSVTTYLYDHGQLEKVGGQSKMAQLVDRTVTSINIDGHARLLLDKYLRRKVIQLGHEITYLGYESIAELKQTLSLIEEKTLALTQSHQVEGTDHELHRYSKIIEEIRKIELEVLDPGFKTFRLMNLSKKWGYSTQQLESIYFKSLLNEEVEPMMEFAEAIAKYGAELKEWLLHGFLPKATTILLHAAGGVGKTRLAYNFCYHLATGTNWDNFPVTAPNRRCLIIQTDEAASDMLAAVADRGLDNPNIRFVTKWTIDHIQHLRQWIEEFKPEMVLIDSLTSVSRHSLFSENDAEYARPILLLRDIAQQYNCTILLVHHDSKIGDARGTSAIFNSVSEVLSLKHLPDNTNNPAAPERLLTIEKSRSRSPARYQLRFNPDDKSWTCLGKDGEEPFSPSTSTKESITAFLCQNRGTRYEALEIQQAIGGSLDHLRRCAYQLAEDGAISRDRANRSEAYKYWVDGAGDHWDDHSNDQRSDGGFAVLKPRSTGDSTTIENSLCKKVITHAHGCDQPQEDQPVRDTTSGDHLPPKIASEKDQQNLSDIFPSSYKPTPEPLQSEDCRGDHGGDHLPDHDDHGGDHLPDHADHPLPPIEIGDRVRYVGEHQSYKRYRKKEMVVVNIVNGVVYCDGCRDGFQPWTLEKVVAEPVAVEEKIPLPDAPLLFVEGEES